MCASGVPSQRRRRAAGLSEPARGFRTLISCEQAARHLGEPGWVFVDCRAVLGEPTRGRALYEQGHIPGAVYADLESDLSGPVEPGRTGRHPLPDKRALAATLGGWGITESTQVVAYDADAGAMAAARLWWLLQWAGLATAAVLDGGLRAWIGLGLAAEPDVPSQSPAEFAARFREDLAVRTAQIEESLHSHSLLLVDSRAPDRYRGENETVDRVAGRIPGALSIPFAGNTATGGRFLPARRLDQRFRALGDTPPEHAVFYCGSGVTAAHNILACAHAGFGMPLLYPGSWSEWITDPGRPVESG